MNATRLSQLQAYTSPWLKAADLQGRPVTVTIDSVDVEDIRQMDGRTEARIVLRFQGKSKRLICNKTQALAIADLARTEEFGRWVGLTLILQPAKTRAGQYTINVLRGNALTVRHTGPDAPRFTVIDGKRLLTADDNPFTDEAAGA